MEKPVGDAHLGRHRVRVRHRPLRDRVRVLALVLVAQRKAGQAPQPQSLAPAREPDRRRSYRVRRG